MTPKDKFSTFACSMDKRYSIKAPKILLEQWIEKGEHEQQDFKFEISDAKKIARSLAAFSNTSGGRLLVGVKDNGVVAGVRSEEELFMLQSAAEMYCQPPVQLQYEEWQVQGKKVLEVKVPYQDEYLIKAPDKEGHYKVYIRVKDQNLLANGVYVRYWKARKQGRHIQIQYTALEKAFLQILNDKGALTKSQIMKRLHISSKQTDNMLIDFMLLDLVQLKMTEEGYYYSLCEQNQG